MENFRVSKNLKIFFVSPILIEKVRRWKYTVTLLEKFFSIKQGGTLLNIISVNQCWIRGDNYKAKACSIWDAFFGFDLFQAGFHFDLPCSEWHYPDFVKNWVKNHADTFWSFLNE